MSYNIAIDGPAGAGKSTIAKRVSAELSFIYVDTGAMYRAIALYLLKNAIQPEDLDSVKHALGEIEIAIRYVGGEQHVLLNGEDVSKEIRSKEVTAIVSQISSIIPVREKMVEVQRKLATGKNVIVEGRDIGTVVFPNADLKIYLDASEEIRAKRRYKENMENGINTTYEEVLENVKLRDYNDKNKKVGALKKAEDAVVIDSSKMTIDEVVEKIKKLIKQS